MYWQILNYLLEAYAFENVMVKEETDAMNYSDPRTCLPFPLGGFSEKIT